MLRGALRALLKFFVALATLYDLNEPLIYDSLSCSINYAAQSFLSDDFLISMWNACSDFCRYLCGMKSDFFSLPHVNHNFSLIFRAYCENNARVIFDYGGMERRSELQILDSDISSRNA